MKSLIFGAALLAASLPALAQTNVSISVGQPGFYGRIDLGDAPRPVLVSERPVIIREVPSYRAAPVYLRVPVGHRKHWARFCGRYDACGRPVYFVSDEWYTRTYVPHYQARYRHEVREYRRPEWHGEHGRGHDGWHGEGHGHGNGHDHGHGHGR